MYTILYTKFLWRIIMENYLLPAVLLVYLLSVGLYAKKVESKKA